MNTPSEVDTKTILSALERFVSDFDGTGDLERLEDVLSEFNLFEASSAMGPIARGLIEDYLGPDCRVIDMERFFTALMQALHDAYGGKTGAR